jgi:hypothetical protein
MVRITLSKKDNVDPSSAEAPMAQTLVARPGSKTPNNNLIDDDLGLSNFDAVESKIVCRISSRL